MRLPRFNSTSLTTGIYSLFLVTMSLLLTSCYKFRQNSAVRVLSLAIHSKRIESDWKPYKPSIDITKPLTKKRDEDDSDNNRVSRKYEERGRKPQGSWSKPLRPEGRRERDYRPIISKSAKPWEKEEKSEPAYGHYDGDHIYGINPVRLALTSNRRKIKELIVQQDVESANKKESSVIKEILTLAENLSIPIRHFSKHDLNMMSDNRPHQGVILRASPLSFLKAEPMPSTSQYKVVLALDEVWDPQNFGALLRSSYFLGCHAVVTCAKNSAPLSPTVSKASAGVLELVDVFSTDNMMKWLDLCKENGWQVVGTDLSENAVPFQQLPLEKPTILILGNEGHGIRTNILRRCDHLVSISKNINAETQRTNALQEGSNDGVDSLNVSVTGGILLHYLTTSAPRTSA